MAILLLISILQKMAAFLAQIVPVMGLLVKLDPYQVYVKFQAYEKFCSRLS